MSLESTATYTDSLNIAWPDGTDVRSTADDHLRLIKGAIKRTWANITGAVTATHGDLNQLAGGVVTTANSSASEPGFKGMPLNTQTNDYTLVIGDASKMIKEDTSSKTVTIPANASVAFPIGTVIGIFNASAGNISIAITSDNLFLSGPGSTGTRTLATTGICTIYKYASTSWIISGTGVS